MEWTRGPIIGRGSTATVSLATLVSSGKLVAVKSTELSRSLFLQREQSLLSKISCPYVAKYLGFSVTNENNKPTYNLCMEYMPGGTLYDEIQRHGGRLDERMTRLYTYQILQGLNYLHVNGIAHCDIKSQNVLMGKDGAKIADLGCAKFVEEVEGNASFPTSAFSGTPLFMAPEVARREEQGFAADIWAVGCTVIEMATGTNPWPELTDPVSALYKIGFSSDSPEIPGWLSGNGKDFLRKCLKRDPKERLTAKELLEHPFLGEVEPDHFKDVKKFVTNSPCTVLNHGFWDSLEETESLQNLTNKASSSPNSPVKRIQQLIGCALQSVSSVPNWSLDEDWITVRRNGTEEIKNCSDENDLIMANELSVAATLVLEPISEEELQSSTSNQDLFSEFSFESSSNISNVSIRRDIVLASEDVGDNFVLQNLNFDIDNGNYSFVQFLFLFSCHGHLLIFHFLSTIFLIFPMKHRKIDFRYSVTVMTWFKSHQMGQSLVCVNRRDFYMTNYASESWFPESFCVK
ncbi:putative Mitogen-activated protein kinase kinase kinase [Melia azedarach]|uniref:Mitogen-activated protein kinase kinase kinase n=2 Tax=Melia azedarach TaxID=155640 RepID=A0ACC1YNR9_MELAZ|nr:putative Mitogen-activated protein kinase kinase kinase [Melia azedarach]